MLARDPTERPRDAGVVLDALLELEATLPRAAAGPSRARVRRPPRARWVSAGLLLGLLLAAAVALPALWWWRGGATGQGLILAATSSSQACTWAQFERFDFGMKDAGLRWRNGDFHGQELRMVEREAVWYQGSDWNQLFIPAGTRRPDVFAVQASFQATGGPDVFTSVTFHAYGDPSGPMDYTSSDLVHGRGLALLYDPATGPRYEWGVTDGVNTRRVAAKGALRAGHAGRWHTIRLEGSRSRCWLRVLLDGDPILTETGACDLDGGSFMLGSNGGSYVQANVLWKQVARFEGEQGCQ
jgi:hypothetical protein